MRMASKSLTGLLRSNGLERYKGSSNAVSSSTTNGSESAASYQRPVASFRLQRRSFLQVHYDEIWKSVTTGN